MILQREIIKEIFFLFCISLTALFSMLLIGRLFKLKDLLVGQQTSLLDIGKLLVYLSPFLLNLLLPVVCLLSVFLVFLRMGADREITALGASGISPLRLLSAPFLFCLLVSMLAFGNSVFGISWGMENFRQTVLDMARSKARVALQPGVFNQDFPDVTLFVHSVDPQEEKVRNLFIKTEKDGQTYIIAPTGQILADQDKGQVFFFVQNGTLYHQKDDTSLVLGFDEYRLRLDLSRWLKHIEPMQEKVKFMSFFRLLSILRGQEKNPAKTSYQVPLEIHKRLAQPFSCLILGCFALPLALLFQGLRRQYGIVLTFCLFLFYYALSSIGETLGKNGSITPALAIWQANLFFSLLFVFFMTLASHGNRPGRAGFWSVFKGRKSA